MDKVIVIGCFIPGMAVVRALGSKGIPAIAMTYSKNDIAQQSRYVSEVVQIPHPQEEPEKFVDFLLSNAHRWEGSLILETSDHTSVCLSRHKERLSKHYRIVTPDWDVLCTFIEKESTYALAKDCAVPHPKGTTLQPSSHPGVTEDLQYPLILKPVRSFEFVNTFKVKNFQVNNEREFEQKSQLCLDAHIPMIIQEIIPGPDDYLYKLQGYINSKGQMVGKFFHKKLRQNPPQFGVMRVGVSTARNAEVEQLTEKLLTHANYRGYFSIEFKWDHRDGVLKLMENNCRMPRSGTLALGAGINFPWMIYLDLVKNQQIDVTDYKKNFYIIELLADITNSISHHDKEEVTLADYFKPYLAKDKIFADLDPHDMQPFMKLVADKVKGLWGKK